MASSNIWTLLLCQIITIIFLPGFICNVTIAIVSFKSHYLLTLFIIVFRIIPESPRWLGGRGREKEALAILERIAKSNNTVMPKVEDTKELMKVEEDQLSFKMALQCKELLIRVFIVLSNM